MMTRLFISLCLLLGCTSVMAQGMALIRNYAAAEYGAHNRNFDILAHEDGTVYVANFEGLLYYDNAEWHILHTPNYANLTTLYLDHSGVLWVGGYNYIGEVRPRDNGELCLKPVDGKGISGEVLKIWEDDKGRLTYLVNDGSIYQIVDGSIRTVPNASQIDAKAGLTDAVEVSRDQSGYKVAILSDTTQRVTLDEGFEVAVRKGGGLVVTQPSTGKNYTVTQRNGLCSDNIVRVSYNGHGLLWGATDNGLFCLAIPSSYSRFTSYEGLTGDVLSITEFKGRRYVGTSDGLYCLEGNRQFVRVQGVKLACWGLLEDGNRLLAATANGIYSVAGPAEVMRLTEQSCTALFRDGDCLYTGEADGVWMQETGKARRRVFELPYVDHIYKDGNGAFWLSNVYGKAGVRRASDRDFRAYHLQDDAESAVTIVKTGSDVVALKAESTKPFPYPLFSYADEQGTTWLTDAEGKHLYAWKDGRRQTDWTKFLTPLRDMTIRSVYRKGNELWVGGQNGITIINTTVRDAAILTKSRLRFRSARLGNDSILWGGFTEGTTLNLASNERNLSFTYGVDFAPLIGGTLYRFQLDNEGWSGWTSEQMLSFNGISYGTYRLSVQAMLPSGELTDVATIDFVIAFPFYLKWYMQFFYLFLLALIAYGVFRHRIRRLEREKQKLESTVKERTADLEQALANLGNAQQELLRSERMATVGKLTQGLVDRILNPLNYITNFTKLSGDLVKDIRENVEDEKDSMDADNYDDTVDALGLLHDNLQKVDKHSQNTTRMVKAMGEIMKDRTTAFRQLDLVAVLGQTFETFRNQKSHEIGEHTISVSADMPSTPMMLQGSAQQLNKAITSLLDNALFAIIRKDSKGHYEGALSLKVTAVEDHAVIAVTDNGIGIEATIMDKIFDPFFTTKTTSEATGIGLYICREIIQNHRGDISVRSEKNVLTEFIITLPLTENL